MGACLQFDGHAGRAQLEDLYALGTRTSRVFDRVKVVLGTRGPVTTRLPRLVVTLFKFVSTVSHVLLVFSR